MPKIDLPKSFDTVVDSGFETLVVSGCSFTHNYSDQHRVSWPCILADRLNIPVLWDNSLSAAGNRHISQSTQWCLETQQPNPATTLVVVMWSGHGREDQIVDPKNLLPGAPTYSYTDRAATALLSRSGQVNIHASKQYLHQSPGSSAVTSYLSINALHNYLKANQYRWVFLDFMDRSLPNRSNDFELVTQLPGELHQRVKEMIPRDIENFYAWSLKRLLLEDDDFHPCAEAHLGWCDQVLVPYLIKKFNLPLAAHTHAIQ